MATPNPQAPARASLAMCNFFCRHRPQLGALTRLLAATSPSPSIPFVTSSATTDAVQERLASGVAQGRSRPRVDGRAGKPDVARYRACCTGDLRRATARGGGSGSSGIPSCSNPWRCAGPRRRPQRRAVTQGPTGQHGVQGRPGDASSRSQPHQRLAHPYRGASTNVCRHDKARRGEHDDGRSMLEPTHLLTLAEDNPALNGWR
jgi:hypothetical protein